MKWMKANGLEKVSWRSSKRTNYGSLFARYGSSIQLNNSLKSIDVSYFSGNHCEQKSSGMNCWLHRLGDLGSWMHHILSHFFYLVRVPVHLPASRKEKKGQGQGTWAYPFPLRSRPGTCVYHFRICFFCQNIVIWLPSTGKQEIWSLFCEVMYLAKIQKFCYSQKKGESISGNKSRSLS